MPADENDLAVRRGGLDQVRQINGAGHVLRRGRRLLAVDHKTHHPRPKRRNALGRLLIVQTQGFGVQDVNGKPLDAAMIGQHPRPDRRLNGGVILGQVLIDLMGRVGVDEKNVKLFHHVPICSRTGCA